MVLVDKMVSFKRELYRQEKSRYTIEKYLDFIAHIEYPIQGRALLCLIFIARSKVNPRLCRGKEKALAMKEVDNEKAPC